MLYLKIDFVLTVLNKNLNNYQIFINLETK